MATLPPINRARILMDLIFDDQVTTLSNYSNDKIDYLSPEKSIAVATNIWNVYGPPINPNTGEQFPDTNANKAKFLIHWLKKIFTQCSVQLEAPAAGDAAKAAKKAEIEDNAPNNVGPDEEFEEDEE